MLFLQVEEFAKSIDVSQYKLFQDNQVEIGNVMRTRSATPPWQCATSPDWTIIDEQLCQRLNDLHFNLSNEICDSGTAALRFSEILSELLLEFDVLRSHGHHGKHRVRKIESTVSELAAMKRSHYHTVEIGCLGHYLTETLTSMKRVSNLSFSKTKALLDRAAAVAITSSQRIFYARSNPTWTL